ncbi:hypothetical protein OTU49_002468, partial [Cherax quadricarinatus]
KRQPPSGSSHRPDGEAPRRNLADEVIEDLPRLKSWSDEVDRVMPVESSCVTLPGTVNHDVVEYGGRESPQAREDADMDANIVSTLSDLLASQEYDSVPCVPALECSDEERPQLKDVDQLI